MSGCAEEEKIVARPCSRWLMFGGSLKLMRGTWTAGCRELRGGITRQERREGVEHVAAKSTWSSEGVVSTSSNERLDWRQWLCVDDAPNSFLRQL